MITIYHKVNHVYYGPSKEAKEKAITVETAKARESQTIALVHLHTTVLTCRGQDHFVVVP